MSHAAHLLEPEAPQEAADAPRPVPTSAGPADRAFDALLAGIGGLVLAVMALVGLFLLVRAWEALRVAGWGFVTTQAWVPESGNFGIAAVLTGTIVIAIIAIAIALPLALGTAVFISEFTRGRLQRTLINLVDLMAAVPSVVYGLFGFYLLQPGILVRGDEGDGLPRFLATYLGWIPVFQVEGDPRAATGTATVYTASAFIAGIVVAMMVTPIACSIMRESFSQAPVGEREGAFALGATRWGMIRTVVLPFGRGGIIGGTMLGLGRALGETIAVFMIISPIFEISIRILQVGTNSVSSLIALRYGESTQIGISALMAAGLALFALTLVVNFVASTAIARSRSGAVSDA